MLNIVVVLICVTTGTMIWIVNRWAVQRGARAEYLGVCISLVAALLSFAAGLVTGQDFFQPWANIPGLVMGITYSIGFCMINFYCLKIGPAAPTVMINNLGLLWPVVIGLIWFPNGKNISFILLFGIFIIILSMVLMSRSGISKESAVSITPKWARFAFLGWIFSGIGMVSSLVSSQMAPGNVFAYMVTGYLLSFLIMFVINLYKGITLPSKFEIIAGLNGGVYMVYAIPLNYFLLGRIPPAILYPILVSTPIILMMLTGHFLLNEKLSKTGWLAVLLAVVGIAVLSGM
ncbi:MAG: hypothetical protein FIA99_08735 [Ruminiclostridium sp.]|nr:hypothetical protein [Ruminiclostridium sp.]